MKRVISILVIICMLFTVAYADTELTVQEIAKQASSVVLVNVLNDKNEVSKIGSGFVVSADGKIMTNYHVIDGATKIEVIMSDNKKYPVLGMVNGSKDQDIAVLKIKAENLPALPLGDSDKLAIGENIVTIGSPLGLQNTVSTGIVSSIRNNLYRSGKGLKDIQISAPTSHGSSGGALFNMQGQVIGITYAGEIEGQNLNYAIPINEAKAFMYPRPYTELPKINSSKLLSQIESLDMYYSLEKLGQIIMNINSELYIGYDEYLIKDNTHSLDGSCVDTINFAISEYNRNNKLIDAYILSGGSTYDAISMRSIMDDYNQAIDCFTDAHKSVINYIGSNRKSYFDDYENFRTKGYETVSFAKVRANASYLALLDIIKKSLAK